MVVKVKYKAKWLIKVIPEDQLKFKDLNSIKKIVNPNQIDDTQKSIDDLSDFVDEGKAKIGGIPKSHATAKLDINEKVAAVINATSSKKNIPQGFTLKFNSMGIKKTQAFTGVYTTEPKNIELEPLIIKEESGMGVVDKTFGSGTLKKTLSTELLSNKSGVIYNVSKSGVVLNDIPVGKSIIEDLYTKKQIKGEELLEAAMAAQLNYNRLCEALDSFECKSDVLGLIKLNFYGVFKNTEDAMFPHNFDPEFEDYFNSIKADDKNFGIQMGSNCVEIQINIDEFKI